MVEQDTQRQYAAILAHKGTIYRDAMCMRPSVAVCHIQGVKIGTISGRGRIIERLFYAHSPRRVFLNCDTRFSA